MAIFEVVKAPNPILREKSKKVKNIDESIRKIASDLCETIESHQSDVESGVAMAAIQAGTPLKIIVIREEDGNYLCLLNPEIVKIYGKEKEDLEGCLSVPGIYGMVKRPEKIKIKALDLNNKTVEFKAEDLFSRILQHEVDHTNGLIFTDRIEDLDKLYKLRKDGKLISHAGKIINEEKRDF